jgi:hypothetical protein
VADLALLLVRGLAFVGAAVGDPAVYADRQDSGQHRPAQAELSGHGVLPLRVRARLALEGHRDKPTVRLIEGPGLG